MAIVPPRSPFVSAVAASLFRPAVLRRSVRLAALALSLAVAGPATAAGETAAPAASSLQELAFVLGTLFPRLDGSVTAVQGDAVEIDRGLNQGLRPGLVLTVTRLGTSFRHPLTGVVLGESEIRLGALIIEHVSADHAVGRFIAATPSTAAIVQPGDRVRTDEGRLPVALVSTAASQVVTARFREALEGTGRFHLLSFTPSIPVPVLISESIGCGGPCGEISEAGRLTDSAARTDAAPSSSQRAPSAAPTPSVKCGGPCGNEQSSSAAPTPQASYAAETTALAAAALAQGADYLIIFDARLRPVGAMGAVLILETREGRQVDAVQVSLRLNPEELPAPPPGGAPDQQIDPMLQVMATREGQAFRVVDLPYRAEHFILGDLDGDGVPELAVSDGSRLRLYRLKALTPELLAEEPVDRADRRQLAIDLADINHTGHPQLFVTAMSGDRLDSYVLQWQDGALTRAAEHLPYYFRVLTPPKGPALLIGQKGSITTAFYDRVTTLEWTGRDYREGEVLTLPKGVTIYDFTVADFAHDGRGQLVYLDRDDRLVLVDPDGRVLGRSHDSFGGVESFIEYRPIAVTQGQDQPPLRARIPARLTVADLDGDGAMEIAVPQNVPWTKRLERLKVYRYGRIHALRWDGRQFAEPWTIPRVEGIIADMAVARLLGPGGGVQVMVLINPTAQDKVSDLKELFSTRSQLLFYAVPHASG